MEILVLRGGGENKGDPIYDPLICSIPVALVRGRNELDAAEPQQPVTIEVVYRPEYRIGALVQVRSPFPDESWFGKITSITHNHNLMSTLEILRKA